MYSWHCLILCYTCNDLSNTWLLQTLISWRFLWFQQRTVLWCTHHQNQEKRLINLLNFSWLNDYEITALSSAWNVDLFILKFVKFCCFLTALSIILMFIIIFCFYDERSTHFISSQFLKLHFFLSLCCNQQHCHFSYFNDQCSIFFWTLSQNYD